MQELLDLFIELKNEIKIYCEETDNKKFNWESFRLFEKIFDLIVSIIEETKGIDTLTL